MALAQTSAESLEFRSPQVELPQSVVEFKLVRAGNESVQWETLCFNENHRIHLKNLSQVQVIIKEGESAVTVVPEHQLTERTAVPTVNTIDENVDMEDANKFTKRVSLTGNESVIIASMELPVNVVKCASGRWDVVVKDIPLYPMMHKLLQEKCREVKWVGYIDLPKEVTEEEKTEIEKLLASKHCVPVYIEHELITKFLLYYEKVLYPFFHNFVCPTDNFEFMTSEYWEAYNSVNKRFSSIIIELSIANPLIWLNDMHLLMCPLQIIRKNVYANIGLFIHSSFPSGEIYKLFPYREDILRSLLCCNIVGFHVFSYARNFLNSCRRILGITNQTM